MVSVSLLFPVVIYLLSVSEFRIIKPLIYIIFIIFLVPSFITLSYIFITTPIYVNVTEDRLFSYSLLEKIEIQKRDVKMYSKFGTSLFIYYMKNGKTKSYNHGNLNRNVEEYIEKEFLRGLKQINQRKTLHEEKK